MLGPLIRKLQIGAKLSEADCMRLNQTAHQMRELGGREDIIKEGDKPDDVHVVLSGFACRYKMLANGERQIMAWLVPGDTCDLHVSILGEMDHTIGTLTPCQVAFIPRRTIEELTAKGGMITRALWWATLVDEAVLREWLVGMGRRAADKRMAHLFCELFLRLRSVGLITDNSCDFAVTQDELADTLGLSTVHVNRTLQQLRDDGLVILAGRRLMIPDPERLQAFADFNPNYLHLGIRSGRGE